MVSNIILTEHKVRSVYALMIHSYSQSYVATFALLVGLQKLGGLSDSLHPFYYNLFVLIWQNLCSIGNLQNSSLLLPLPFFNKLCFRKNAQGIIGLGNWIYINISVSININFNILWGSFQT